MPSEKVSIVITAVDKTKAVLASTERNMGKLRGKINEHGASIKFATAAMAGGVALIGQRALKAAGDFEQTTVAFRTMLGNAEQANDLLQDLAQFAAKTPFQLTEVERGAKQLLAMDTSAQDLLPTLKTLGDVSSGLNVPMERLILNYGQVRIQGKLTGRELRDFSVAGVPLIAALADELGVAKEEIADMVSAGDIGFPLVEKAFQNMTGEGGKFFDLMDEQSKTTQGQISNLKDEVNLLERELGKELLPVLKDDLIPFLRNDVLPTISLMIQGFKELQDPITNTGKAIKFDPSSSRSTWSYTWGIRTQGKRRAC